LIGGAGHLDGQVGHVDRAQGPVEDGHPYQEEGGGEGVDDDVLQALLELEALPAQGEEDEGGEECHLIKDEEVEEVPGQERAVDACQLDVEERVEEGPLPRLIQG